MTDLPEPLTPPDCDLRGLPFMQLDIVRLIDSDLFALSTGDEFKAAVALWCKSWLQVPAASLPDDDRVLAHLSSSGVRWKKVKSLALRGWIKCADGRLYHPTVAEKALHAWKARIAQRERAAKRWQKKEAASGNATASENDMPRHSDGTSHGNALERERERESKKKDTLTTFGTPAAPSSPDEDPPTPTPVAPEAKPPTPPDQRSVLFGIGSQIVGSMTGKPPNATKSLIGKWLRDLRDDCAVLNGIIQEAADTRPADPVSWITGAVKARGDGRAADRTRRWALDGVDLDAAAEEGWKEMGL